MSNPPRSRIEELKKSFPALDDFAEAKLLGGDVGSHDVELNPQVVVDEGIPNVLPGTAVVFHTGSSGTGTGGYTYFGDSDGTDDEFDQGSGDWGEVGVGSSDSWQPDDFENWLNSGPWIDHSDDWTHEGSGNPGGQQGVGLPQWQGPQPQRINNWNLGQQRPYDIFNSSTDSIMVQYGPFGTQPQIIPPQGTFTAPEGDDWEVDGINIHGYTFKLTDGFNFVEVYDDHWTTNYHIPGSNFIYEVLGGLQLEPPTDDGNWDQIFYWSP